MSQQPISNSNRILSLISKGVLFCLLVIVLFIVGVCIGYVVLGNGPIWEVFNRDTWQHIIEFVR